MRRLTVIFFIILIVLSAFNFNFVKSDGLETSFVSPDNSSSDTSTKQIDDKIKSIIGLDKFNFGSSGRFFTANQGQVGSEDVKYYIQGQGVWFTNSKVIFELKKPQEINRDRSDRFEMGTKGLENNEIKIEDRNSVVVEFEFANSNKVTPVGCEELPHKSNFFYGSDPGKWCTDVPNYRSILYRSIYDNIDLKYYFNEEKLKYDLMIRPGGNPDDIMIKITKINDLSIDSNGDILIETALYNIFDKDLFVYQEYDGNIHEMEANFKLLNSNGYGFEIPIDFNKNETLVIDPLIYSTYIGGGSDDVIHDIAIDETGNAYLTGETFSSNFPVKMGSYDNSYNGERDIFVTKLNSDGTSLAYSTFIGGSSIEYISGIAVDTNGNAYITGYTSSTDFPTTPGAYDESFNGLNFDVIVSKLTPGGNNLNFSTFIGGDVFLTGGDPSHWGDIVLDDQGNAYITGTGMYTYPVTPGVYSYNPSLGSHYVIISKFNANGTDLIYSTIIGSLYGNDNYGVGIALDYENNICITGIASSDFPTTPGAYKESMTGLWCEDFVLKLNANFTKLLYSTYTGNIYINSYSLDPDILIDSEGSVIITGPTAVNNFTTTSDAYDGSYNGANDILILKFNFDLSSLLYATYLGGNEYDYAYASVLDGSDNVIITGSTSSPDFPVLEGGYDLSYNGGFDVFVAKLNLTHSEIRYSSYIGGNSDDKGYDIDIDDKGYVYLAGKSGPGFPTTPDSFDPTFNGGSYDAFALKMSPICLPRVIDLHVSEPVVYRSNAIELYSNASDFEDSEWVLTPYFKYRAPGQNNWSVDLLEPPSYINERWQSTFTIPINASLGFYNFRVRFNDTEYMWTPWWYLNGSLRVLNNPPEIDHFNISKHTVEIGESFQLFVNGTDVEDELQKLTFELEYKHYDDTLWDPLEFEAKKLFESGWEYNITFDNSMDYGYYDLRAMVCDSDLGYSDWSELDGGLLVTPAKPRVISIDLSKQKILRTEIVEAYIECTDPDSEYDELYVELQYTAESDGLWHDLSTDPINLRWEASWKSKKTSLPGNYSFRAKPFDFEDNEGSWFYLNNSLMVLNNIPELLDINNIPDEMLRKESAVISIDAKDVENKEDLLGIEFEYREPEGSDWVIGYLSELYYSNSSWQCEFTLPEDAPMGTYSFRARVQDLDGAWSDHVYLNDSLSVGNSLPVILSFEQYPLEVYRTGSIMITASGTDLETSDEQLVCFIYYQAPGSTDWSELTVQYNSSSNNWQSEHITTKTSVLGKYSFKTILMDNDGEFSMPVYAYGTVLVKNNLPVISDDLDDIEVGTSKRILKLMDYGYDVENSKDKLSWSIDPASIDTLLFHIDAEHIGDQELVINPVPGKNGRRDITLILTDSDGGRAEKTTVTILVDSRAGSKADTEPDENPMIKLVGGTNILIYLLIIIMIIIFITILFLVRRKKQKRKEDDQKKIEEQQQDAEADEIAVVGEPVATSIETPIPVPAPTLEEPPVPTPVPMPTPFPTPILPVTTADAEPQPEIAEDASPQNEASEEPVQQANETDGSDSGD